MKAEELRIGNFVRAKSPEKEVYQEPVKVDIHYLDMFCHDKKLVHFEPIPLTEEWLIRFGFSSRLDNLFYVNFFFTLAKSEEGFRLWIVSGTYGRTIHYVHELQNLYFALTGQELTLAPPQR